MSLDFRQTPRAALHRAARAGLFLGIPLALVLGAAGVSRAFDAASGWTVGETLTAADLNTLVVRLGGLAAGLSSQSATVDALVSEVTTVKTQVASLEAGTADVSALKARVASLEAGAAEVTALKARVASLEAGVAEVSDLKARLASLEDAVANAPFGREFVASTSDRQTDLGDQLKALLSQHRNVHLTLARGTAATPAEYRWNTRVDLPAGARLVIEGDGYENVAANLGVRILMDVALSRIESDGSTRRAPARLVANARSEFMLRGVSVIESGNSGLEPTYQCTLAALFTVGEQALVTIDQSRITSTEHIVNPHERAVGHVRFGHTWIDRHPAVATGKPNINPVATYPGWCWTGGGVIVSSVSSTHLGSGVDWLSAYPNNLIKFD